MRVEAVSRYEPASRPFWGARGSGASAWGARRLGEPVRGALSSCGMSRAVHARLVAARVLLGSAHDAATAAAISKTHADALKENLVRERSGYSAGTRADVSVAINDIAWRDADKEALLQCLMGDVAVARESRAQRRQAQDWKRITDIYPQKVWGLLMGSASTWAKLDALLLVPMQLGLRLPSEPTLHLLSSMWIVISDGGGAAEYKIKSAMAEALKKEFRRRRRSFGNPQEWFADHPPETGAFYESEGPPVPCPSAVLNAVFECNLTFRCRTSGGQGVDMQLGGSSPSERAMMTMYETGMRMMSTMARGNMQAPSAGGSGGDNLLRGLVDLRGVPKMGQLPLHRSPVQLGGLGQLALAPPQGLSGSDGQSSQAAVQQGFESQTTQLGGSDSQTSRALAVRGRESQTSPLGGDGEEEGGGDAPLLCIGGGIGGSAVDLVATPSRAPIGGRGVELYTMIQERDDQKKEEVKEKKKAATALARQLRQGSEALTPQTAAPPPKAGPEAKAEAVPKAAAAIGDTRGGGALAQAVTPPPKARRGAGAGAQAATPPPPKTKKTKKGAAPKKKGRPPKARGQGVEAQAAAPPPKAKGEDATAQAAAPPPKAVPKAKAEAKGKAAAKAKVEAGAKKRPAAAEADEAVTKKHRSGPHYNLERTRQNICCRTGESSGSKSIRYGSKYNKTEAEAVIEAQTWVKEQLAAQLAA